MASLERLWLAILTRDVEDAGTNSRLILRIRQHGNLVVDHTFEKDTPQEDLERGKANLYTVGVYPSQLRISPR